MAIITASDPKTNLLRVDMESLLRNELDQQKRTPTPGMFFPIH